jgi:tRNA pseudouridine55 synthase
VARVRRTLGLRRVGHAGTLDPFATGLLLVLVGRATRVQRFLMPLPKTYEVVARLGAVSSTGDPEGEITQTGRVPERLSLPVGELRQRPPAYSAVKVGGERAYRRARRGEDVEPPERVVTVYRFEQRWREDDRVAFEIECSAGTYVRSLITDLGDAYCEALRRTSIGHFSVDDAVAAPDRSPSGEDATRSLAAGWGSLGDALAFLPERRLSAQDARAAAHGRAVPGEAGGPVRLVDEEGGLVALAEPRQAGVLKPVVGFRA